MNGTEVWYRVVHGRGRRRLGHFETKAAALAFAETTATALGETLLVLRVKLPKSECDRLRRPKRTKEEILEIGRQEPLPIPGCPVGGWPFDPLGSPSMADAAPIVDVVRMLEAEKKR